MINFISCQGVELNKLIIGVATKRPPALGRRPDGKVALFR
jgi:hypothetical protein